MGHVLADVWNWLTVEDPQCDD
eukprot:COSAG05_NODE_23969_length_254_cov_1.264516_1_plen_21_part_10